ncbi:hypothetical protein J2739_005459 [Variovorax soli]|uniref:Uncharacterized protein n=2 Tax=Variovorax soli TaxID=376815 RepID=A0ABU1NMI1_9BURK|nr:hypothetical protein [Variovorax soli]
MLDSFLELPKDFDDYEWEVVAKGCFTGVKLIVAGVTHSLNFYDPIRLGQEMTDELRGEDIFYEPNLIVVRSVQRLAMERAVELLMNSGRFKSLTPD